MSENISSFLSVVGATLRADNRNATARQTEITAEVHFSGNDVTGFSNGIASWLGEPEKVCFFSESNGNTVSTDFRNFTSTEEQVETLREIKAFITAVRAAGASAFNLTGDEGQ